MPWLYNKHTGDVEHQNEAQWLLDEPLAGSVGLVKLPIPDNDTAAQAIAYVTAHFPNDAAPTTSTAVANQRATQTVTGFSSIQNALSAFYAKVTDGKMWRSLGWLALGVLLIFIGLRLWIGTSIQGLAKQVPGLPGRIARAA
jgi:hypothetical protein